MSDSLWPHGLWPARLLCPWDSPGKDTGVGSLSLLQGVLPTQGSNPGLLLCRQILYHLSHQGTQWSPWGCYYFSKNASNMNPPWVAATPEKDVLPKSADPIPEDILKTNVIRFQICLKSFLFKSHWMYTAFYIIGLLQRVVFERGTEQLRQIGRHLALRRQWPDDRVCWDGLGAGVFRCFQSSPTPG